MDPSLPQYGGHVFVRDYVIAELAARQRDELLLWDLWGAMGAPEGEAPPGILSDVSDAEADALVDEVAALLLAAVANGADAEAELEARYAADDRLRPGDRVLTFSPTGRGGITDLGARTSDWLVRRARTVIG